MKPQKHRETVLSSWKYINKGFFLNKNKNHNVKVNFIEFDYLYKELNSKVTEKIWRFKKYMRHRQHCASLTTLHVTDNIDVAVESVVGETPPYFRALGIRIESIVTDFNTIYYNPSTKFDDSNKSWNNQYRPL